jgi:hypothetical protein
MKQGILLAPKMQVMCANQKKRCGTGRRLRLGIRKPIIPLLLVAVLWVLAFVATAPAVLPPGSYDTLRAEAEEKLKIKVVGVEQKAQSDCYLDVLFTAEVLHVERSQTGIKPGDTIQIQSYRWTKRYAGPMNPPLLPTGWLGIVYLNKVDGDAKDADKIYKIAAYGASFEESQ